MRRARWIATLLALFQLNCVACAAELAELVRDLNAIQNRMAVGDPVAREQAAKQFDAIEKQIETVDPASWSDQRNVYAVVVYLLCGGAPSKLREILGAKFVNEKLSPLLGVSLEYAEGQDSGLPKGLLNFDARQFQRMLGGHLALVQGGSLIGQDNARAISLLDLARLLMPGSLVEEAALRREIAILDPVRDVDKLGLLSMRYVSKYVNSPFAASFWDVVRNATSGDAGFLSRSSRFSAVFERAPQAERLSFYLALSRQALYVGQFGEATKAIVKAESAATEGLARKRVGAYRDVLAALTGEGDAGALRSIELKQLNREDAALVAMASSIVSGLSARDQSAAAGAPDEKYEIATNIRRALSQGDELLKRAASK